MNLRTTYFALFIILTISMLSCSGDKDGAIQHKSASLTMKSLDLTQEHISDIDFFEAIIHVERVDLEASDLETVNSAVEFQGPFEIDLISGRSQPNISSVTLPLGNYDKVSLVLDKDVYPYILVSGFVNVEGSAPLEFIFYSNEDILFEADAVQQHYLLKVMDDRHVDINVELQLSDWFKGIDWKAGKPGKDGVMNISLDENRTLFNQIIRNMEQSKLLVNTK